MEVFYLNLAVVYICSLFARYLSKIKAGIVLPNKIFVLFVVVTMVLVAGLQNNIGDTYFYMHSFSLNTITWEDIEFKGEFGFNIYQMYLQKISEDPQILIFVTALITNILIVSVFYKYSRLFEISLYVYITAGMFLVSMNGIRQFLAAAIIFAATKYIMSGSWKKYVLIILLASTIHQSALVLIPIYFIVRRKAWTKESYLLIFFAILLVAGFNQFSSILFSVIEDTKYSEYSGINEGGANILRVFIHAIPVVLAYLGRDKLKEIYPNSDYIVNLALINLIIMMIATQNWIFARFNIYFGLYNILLLSWIVKVFTKKDQKLVYFSIMIFYFIYFYYEHVISLSIRYGSDYISL